LILSSAIINNISIMKKFTLAFFIFLLFISKSVLSQVSESNINSNKLTQPPTKESENYSNIRSVNNSDKSQLKTPGAISVIPLPSTGYTVSSLVQNVLVSGCLVASNISYTGDPAAIGSFSSNGTSFALNNGIIISTGAVTNAMGPNLFTNVTTQFATPGDADLNVITGSNSTKDAAVLQFDFIPANNTVEFRYIFASDEYPEWACGHFNDVFAFLLSGPGIAGGQGFSNDAKNIALLPDNVTPVTTNNIHIAGWNQGNFESSPNPVTCPDQNPQYYVSNIGSNSIEYDGMTVVLTAHWTVIPCQTYHIKFAIADVADRKYDSGVFIEGASFTSNPVTMNNFNLNGNQTSDIYEGCNYNFEFSRNNLNNTNPLTIHFSLTGLADSLDHTFPSDSVVIPAGIDSIMIPYSAIMDGILEGSENMTIAIGNGCPCSANEILKTLILHDPLTLTTSLNNITCHGSNNGIITANASGGSGTYQYSINGGPLQNSNIFSNLSPGTYYITTDDGTSCMTVADTVTLTDPPVLTLNLAVTNNISCNNGSNGEITASAGGGNGGYNYSINNGPYQASGVFSNLAAGQYIINVTDSQGCNVSDTVIISQPSLLVATIVYSNDASCNRFFDGSAVVSATGGTPTYSYLWSNGNTLPNNDYLTADIYFVTVTDINSCSASTSITINEPDLLTATISAFTNVSCNGGNNGSATVVGAGGTLPYGYMWSNGNTNATNTGLSAGTYTVTITDNHGCIAFTSVTILQPTLIVPNTSVITQILCNGGNNGSVSINATGGNPPYTYNWSNGSNQTILTNLSAGTYAATITDNSGCTVSTSVTINQPLVLTATINPTNVLCFNQNNGSAIASASGGTTPYNYLWSNGNNTNTIINLTPGTYSVTATDNNGCTASASVNITQPVLLTTTMLPPVNVTCFNGNNGSATVTPAGGTVPYTYNWSNGTHNGTANGLTNGTYTVTVTDQNGCSATNSVVINQPPQLTTVMGPTTNLTCNGSANGSTTVTANGGTPGYSYTWSNGSHNTTITNLTAGTYKVTVTDNNGCTATNSVTITQPNILTASIARTNVSCFSGNNGSATASASGGTVPYNFHWSNGSNTNVISNLTAGTYSVTVTDNNGCTASASVNITQPVLLTTTMSVPVNVSCFGGNNGSASVTPAGGTSPYTYNWSNGTHNGTATGLVSGTYTVTVTDQNGCTSTNTITINQPIQLTTTISSQANVTCNGVANGSATISANGGVPPYNYTWSNGLHTTTISNLTAGTYTITVTDNNGCTATNTVTITQPNLLTASISKTNVSCFSANNGSAAASASGGTIPYSYLWSNGNNTNVINNLNAGTYSVTITDNNGCTASASVNITQPVLLTTTMAPPVNVSCFGGNNGSATVTTTGGTSPYTYNWSNGANTGNATGLASGTYFVTVTDINGCTSTNLVVINQPSQLSSVISGLTDVACNGGNTGTATVTAIGGIPPYSYSWSNGSTTTLISGLTSGTYLVTITDNHGCVTYNSATINQSVILNASITSSNGTSCFGGNNGAAQSIVTGGNPPYSYNWSNGSNSPNISNLTANVYTLNVSDVNGCTASASITINQPAQIDPVITSANISCFGGNNGLATVNPTGGTPGFQYLWSTGSNAATISNLIAGNYSVTVTDINGCTATNSVTLIQAPITINISTTSTDISCFGLDNGTASASVTGSTGPYVYAWSNGSDSATISDLGAGNYSVTVTDSFGCAISSAAIIHEPALLTATVIVDSNVSCNSGSNGGASVMVTGGTIPYTYNWSNGTSNATTVGLIAGSYMVTIADNNGCSATSSVLISQPTLLTATLSQTNVSCFGGNDGTASVTPSGGTNPYLFLWSIEDINQSITGLIAGSYIVTVTDNNGCMFIDSVLLSQPTMITSVISSTDVVCNGGATGTAAVSASGGIAPYSYVWSNGLHTTSINGLVAGNYTVTITDFFGCTATNSVTINQASSINIIQQSLQNVTCFGGSNGSVSVMVNGGTSPYQYSWTNGSANDSINGLIAGIYQVTVTDSNNCPTIATINISEPALLVSPIVNIFNVSCFGGSNGSVTAQPTGGSWPYSYNWSDGSANAIANNLITGNYSVTVTDLNGCIATNSVSITQPSVLASNITVISNVLCHGGNSGSAVVIANGGTMPYSYLWSNGSILAGSGNLTAGNYSTTVTDQNGCTTSSSVIITEPATLASTISSFTNVSCFNGNDGSATVAANGGVSPYSYLWSNGLTSASINNLSAGIYSVTVTDSNACTSVSNVTINQASQTIFINFSQNNVSCNGGNNGSSTVVAIGITGPYTYNWSTGSTNTTITGLTAGNYTVTVTDSYGCIMISTDTISEPAILSLAVTSTNVSCFNGNNGTADLTISGGTNPYNILWSNGGSSVTLAGLIAGNYSVSVNDQNGCSATSSIVISEPTQLTSAIAATNVSCFGGSNGSAAIAASGGTLPYLYNWSNSDTSASVNGLAAGTYTATVTDANLCTVTDTILITQPLLLASHISASLDASCFGYQDGGAHVATTGGTHPYHYQWDVNGDTTATTLHLGAGVHTVVVTDQNGCTTSASVTISQPAQMIVATYGDTTLCIGNSTNIGLTVSGGTAPYSYIWNPASPNINNLTVVVMSNSVYRVYATDSHGCTSDTGMINLNVYPQLTAVVSGNNSICLGQSTTLNLNISGGVMPYSYVWDNGLGSQPAPLTVSPTSTTTYWVTVYDACNSAPVVDSMMVYVHDIPVASVSTPALTGCGSLDAIFTDNNALNNNTYLWNFGDLASGTADTSTENQPEHLYNQPGTYDVSVTVTTEYGCSAIFAYPQYITVYDVPIAAFRTDLTVVSLDDPVIRCIDESIGAINWLWNFGETSAGSYNTSVQRNPEHSYSEIGYHTIWLWVENNHGCKDSASKEINVLDYYTFYAPNAFTPNSDGLNDEWLIKGNSIDPNAFHVMIYNRWGEMVFETNDMRKGWDGFSKNGNKVSPQGVYTWTAMVKDLMGVEHSYTGSVTLLE
jgi:gliding motility-associated-like protein